MANELEIINNPTSTPELVSTGYQAQNVRSLASSNGVDLTFVEAYDATTVRLRQSGAVDVSGTLYAVGAQVDFTVSSAGRYFIYLADGGDASHKTPTLGTDAGTFDAELNARYLSTGERVLNWLIVKETVGSTKLTVLKMQDPGKLAAHNEPLLLQRTVISSAGTTTWTAPRSQVYTFELQACGGDGGDGTATSPFTTPGGGGGGGGYLKHSEFVATGVVLSLTRSITSAENCQISGAGFTTITAQNGTVGQTGGNPVNAGGVGGSYSGGHGIVGETGDPGYQSLPTASGGGDSTLGFGSFNRDGEGYGAGGAGDYPSHFSGAPGLFLIWG